MAWLNQWRSLLLIVFVVLACQPVLTQCRFSKSKLRRVVRYSFEPVFFDNKMSMRVILEFTGGSSGEAKLEIPSTYAGQKHLENAFNDLKALSDNTTLTEASTARNKIAHFPAGTLVRLSYLLSKDWTGPLNSDTRFRPILERTHFQLLSDTALIKPKLEPVGTQDVYFDFSKLPVEWSFASSFGANDRCQSFHGAWNQVRTALFVGGDYRIRHDKISNKDLVLAIRGKWSFTDNEWVQEVERIIRTERRFWRDNDFPYTLVTLAPFDREGRSYGGSAYTKAFMMHLSPNATLSYEVTSLLAHENFHLWDPYKMGGGQGPVLYWFTEGFTQYYTDLILFRTALMPLSEYVQHINEKLRSYQFSPVINLSNSVLVARYESDRSLNDLPSQRGMALALWLDSHIRKATGNRASLDSVMLQLVNDARNTRFRLNSDRIIQLAEQYLNRDDWPVLREYIEDGKTIPVPEFPLGGCVKVRAESLPQFDIGMDRESLVLNQLVSGVKPDSEAFKAGLRDGQKVVRTSIYWNDVSKPVKLVVSTAEGDRGFEYFPRGPSQQIQQYYLAPDCASKLKGLIH